MRLKLNDLEHLVKDALDNERLAESLRLEVSRVLGPSVITTGVIEEVAAEANDRIDVLMRTGRGNTLAFKTSMFVKLLEHPSAEVRKLAVRALPERFLVRLSRDPNPSVRAAVAHKVPIDTVREMLKRFTGDDELRTIYRQRRLTEVGAALPKELEPHLHMYDAEPLGDAVKQDPGPELSDAWYESRADQFIQDYGTVIEDSWEERAARQYCMSVKATSGVDVDEEKLLKTIKDKLEERDDLTLERSAIKETLEYLKRQQEREMMSTPVMPILEDDVEDK